MLQRSNNGAFCGDVLAAVARHTGLTLTAHSSANAYNTEIAHASNLDNKSNDGTQESGFPGFCTALVASARIQYNTGLQLQVARVASCSMHVRRM